MCCVWCLKICISIVRVGPRHIQVCWRLASRGNIVLEWFKWNNVGSSKPVMLFERRTESAMYCPRTSWKADVTAMCYKYDVLRCICIAEIRIGLGSYSMQWTPNWRCLAMV